MTRQELLNYAFFGGIGEGEADEIKEHLDDMLQCLGEAKEHRDAIASLLDRKAAKHVHGWAAFVRATRPLHPDVRVEYDEEIDNLDRELDEMFPCEPSSE